MQQPPASPACRREKRAAVRESPPTPRQVCRNRAGPLSLGLPLAGKAASHSLPPPLLGAWGCRLYQWIFLTQESNWVGCSAGNHPRPALGCMDLPGPSRSGSGTRVVLRGTDSVGPAFCALPRSESMRVARGSAPWLLNLSGLDLGGACSPGPASDGSRRNNLEPEQCGQGGYTRRERGQTQCG